MAKVLYVVLDGAPDGFESPKRTLEEAWKPNLDSLAENCLGGLLYVVEKGVAPESDVAVMSLLGYDPRIYYTGRGPLEALGAGLELREGAVAFRANFATIDVKTREIRDRRVGRSLTTAEARLLAESLDGMKLDEGKAIARFKATVGHRGVLVLEHNYVKLSGNVSNNDPAYVRTGKISVAVKPTSMSLARVEPLDDSLEARTTAELANEFLERAVEILASHPVNLERSSRGLPPANAILVRDAGDSLPKAPPARALFGASIAGVAEMPVEIGLFRALGVEVLQLPQSTSKQEVLEASAIIAAEALEKHDVVYVHLKGPDEPGHDGDFEEKVRAVEDIDSIFFSRILTSISREDTLIVVTSDHATPWDKRAHSDDPVPLMISHPSLPERRGGFSEHHMREGRLGVIEGGFNVLPLALKLARELRSKQR
ncbi:MAG: 2,3-bisphosphoglycerate-independent phosphoglycerate mutase [Acidilobaceae archaeon]